MKATAYERYLTPDEVWVRELLCPQYSGPCRNPCRIICPTAQGRQRSGDDRIGQWEEIVAGISGKGHDIYPGNFAQTHGNCWQTRGVWPLF